jgi:hypothetical protein
MNGTKLREFEWVSAICVRVGGQAGRLRHDCRIARFQRGSEAAKLAAVQVVSQAAGLPCEMERCTLNLVPFRPGINNTFFIPA